MHKKQKLTLAFTINFNQKFKRELCEKLVRIVFNKANRKLYGRRHKVITAVGNFEFTQNGNTHVHYAVACPVNVMSKFVRIAKQTLDVIAPSSTTDFQLIHNENNVQKWLGYIGKENTLQVDGSTTV